MSCSTHQRKLRPWLRGELSAEEANAVEQHVSNCYFCAVIVEKESSLVDALQARYQVPEPSSDFRSRVMSAAIASHGERFRPTMSMPAVGTAVAAALVLGIGLGVGIGPAENQNPDSMAATSAGASEGIENTQIQTVRLMFNTAQAMQDVTLTVELPPHVEVSGYPGYQRLSWSVSLDQGENIVKLPLNVLFPGEGQLVARLSNGEREKIFRTQLTQTDAGVTSESEL